ncbi:MAG: YbjQ family protein [Catenulispora sp.]|nr:YbjQ family protein [Catenulispora sp.]
MTSDYSGGQDPAINVLVSTMNDLPGFRVERVLGEVFGLTVRARNVASSFGSAMKSLKGGELKGQTRMLVDSRMEAMRRLTDEAANRGGNAVLAMRFETSAGELGTEICAYGTACVVSPASSVQPKR